MITEITELNIPHRVFGVETDEQFTEDSAKQYYESLGFIAIHDYGRYLSDPYEIANPETERLQEYCFLRDSILRHHNSNKIIKLFNVYKNGYPDFVLINRETGNLSFHEVKINADAPSFNQIVFLYELGKLITTYIDRFHMDDTIPIVSPGSSYARNKLDKLINRAEKMGYKNGWIMYRFVFDMYGEKDENRDLNITIDDIIYAYKACGTVKSILIDCLWKIRAYDSYEYVCNALEWEYNPSDLNALSRHTVKKLYPDVQVSNYGERKTYTNERTPKPRLNRKPRTRKLNKQLKKA